MSNPLTIVFVYRTGGDYKWVDVELLRFHCRRWSAGARFVILTDCVTSEVGVDSDTILIPLMDDYPGWWAKMELFRPEMERYRPFLYIDLDTAVLGPLKSVLPDNKTLWMTLENVYYPGRIGSGFMWIPAGSKKIRKIWQAWTDDPARAMLSKTGDQGFIETVAMPDKMWKESVSITSVKPLPKKQFMFCTPEGCVIAYFHGKPRPREARHTIPWVANYFRSFYTPRIETKIVISLKERVDRREAFFAQPEMDGFSIFDAIRKTPGVLGCNASHRAVLSAKYTLPILVCEDDARLTGAWCEVRAAMEELPGDWDMLYLGCNPQSPIKRHSTMLGRLTGRTFMTHAIIWGSRRVVDYLIKNYTDDTPVDVWIGEHVIPRFNCFVTIPMIMHQASGRSDITKGERDYADQVSANLKRYMR